MCGSLQWDKHLFSSCSVSAIFQFLYLQHVDVITGGGGVGLRRIQIYQFDSRGNVQSLYCDAALKSRDVFDHCSLRASYQSTSGASPTSAAVTAKAVDVDEGGRDTRRHSSETNNIKTETGVEM